MEAAVSACCAHPLRQITDPLTPPPEAESAQNHSIPHHVIEGRSGSVAKHAQAEPTSITRNI